MTQAMLVGGDSPAARYIAEQLSASQRLLHKSAAGGMGRVIREELAKVWEECCAPDWDGYDAFPVSWDAYHNATRFLLALPLGIPIPAVGAEPAGNVTFEWQHSRRRTLSISVSSNQELFYAALLGPGRVCGTEFFFGEVPKTILELIERVHSC